MSDAPLSIKQEKFAAEYLLDLNATQAAIRAGYSKSGAEVQAFRLLRDDRVARLIEAGRKTHAQHLEMSAKEVHREFTKLARFDIRKIFHLDGSLKPIHELDDDTAAAISSIEVVTKLVKMGENRPPMVQHTHKIKTHSKVAALENLGRIHGIFQDKMEINGTLTLEALIMGVIAREEAEAKGEPKTIEGKAEES